MDDGKETARLVRLRIEEIRTQQKRRRRMLGATAVAVCLFVVAIAIVASLRLSTPEGIELQDEPMPMGLLEEERGPDPDIIVR